MAPPSKALSDLESAAARYRSGEASTALAKEWGCSPLTMQRRLRALGVVIRAPGSGRKGWERATTPKATTTPTLRDIAWAAGFLEGEGAFYVESMRCERIQVRQVQLEPLQRMQSLFGGALELRKNNRRGFGEHTAEPINEWRINGARARGLMMTVYPFMSPNRKDQIRKALGANRKAG